MSERERIRETGSPKEQPPRNLSGTEDRAGHDTLESETASEAGLHRRGKPGPKPARKLSGSVTEGAMVLWGPFGSMRIVDP